MPGYMIAVGTVVLVGLLVVFVRWLPGARIRARERQLERERLRRARWDAFGHLMGALLSPRDDGAPKPFKTFKVLVPVGEPTFEQLRDTYAAGDPLFETAVFHPVASLEKGALVDGEIDCVLVPTGRQMTEEQGLKLLDVYDLRPLTLAEGHAFASQHPQEQLKAPLLALGSETKIDIDGTEVRMLACWTEREGASFLRRFMPTRGLGDKVFLMATAKKSGASTLAA